MNVCNSRTVNFPFKSAFIISRTSCIIKSDTFFFDYTLPLVRFCKYVTKCLLDHGYALISMKANKLAEKTKELFKDRDIYFSQQQEAKDANKDENNFNIGYVKVTGIREYIKLRKGDPENLWPKEPPDMKDHWISVLDSLKDIAWKIFTSLSSFGPETKLNEPSVQSAIQEFVDSKSSISLIHYFPVPEENKSNCVCGVHEDTGLVTLGVRSDVPGLIVYDRLKQGWVEVEQYVEPGDVVAFLGQKIPLFSGSDAWKATTHKVEVPLMTERNALVFLLDVAK